MKKNKPTPKQLVKRNKFRKLMKNIFSFRKLKTLRKLSEESKAN